MGKKNYFEFFGNHTFNENEQREFLFKYDGAPFLFDLVKFYEDGSFSFYEGGKLLLYSNACELIKSFEYTDLRFDNGCIGIKHLKEGTVDIYFEGQLAYSLETGVQNLGSHDFSSVGNFLIVITSTGTKCYRIASDKANEVQYSIEEYLRENYACDLIEGFVPLGNCFCVLFSAKDNLRHACLFNEHDKDISPKNMKNITPLLDGSCIIETSTECALYNSNMQKLLTSRKPKGISPLGYGHVLYEDVLIAETETGLFVKEYEGERAVSEGGVSIFPYKIVKDNVRLFWTGGVFQLFKVMDFCLFITFYDGKIYPIFIDEMLNDEILLDKKIPTDYATRLASMSFVRETRRIYPPVL